MKYDQETTEKLVADYNAGMSVADLSEKYSQPQRSIIAKLSSLGAYHKSPYLNKRGEVPIKKAEYVERIANLLGVHLDLLESLEKANKNVLQMLERALDPQSQQSGPEDQPAENG